MRHTRIHLSAFVAVVALIAVCNNAAAQAHAHMGHVADQWNDAPDQQGLLPTSQAEAEIASQHITLALSRTDDLEWIQLHIGHVMNAIDPSVEPSGPGLGYGVVKAAGGAATHIRLAAEAPDASDNVKLHATHVKTSADNVVAWAQQVIELCKELKTTEAAAAAAEQAREVEALIKSILNGRDANEDGSTSWQEGEGGLEQAALHMNLMKRGEQMN